MEKLILDRYQDILARMKTAAVAARRDPDSVHLIAVSKTHPFSAIAALYQAGQRDFGENYVQEMLEKAKLARDAGFTEIRWHFIGHLQSNKVRVLLPETFLIHGVGSEKLASEISKRSAPLGRPIAILLEVNLDDEESKAGVRVENARALAEVVSKMPHINLRGLMCIPNPDRAEGAGEAFRRLAALNHELGTLTEGELSMGMTSDFPAAIAAGATYVRVGTAIFGERPKRAE